MKEPFLDSLVVDRVFNTVCRALLHLCYTLLYRALVIETMRRTEPSTLEISTTKNDLKSLSAMNFV